MPADKVPIMQFHASSCRRHPQTNGLTTPLHYMGTAVNHRQTEPHRPYLFHPRSASRGQVVWALWDRGHSRSAAVRSRTSARLLQQLASSPFLCAPCTSAATSSAPFLQTCGSIGTLAPSSFSSRNATPRCLRACGRQCIPWAAVKETTFCKDLCTPWACLSLTSA